MWDSNRLMLKTQTPKWGWRCHHALENKLSAMKMTADDDDLISSHLSICMNGPSCINHPLTGKGNSLQ